MEKLDEGSRIRSQETVYDDLHCLPPVRAEEEVNDMIFRLRLTAEVGVDHLPNRRCPVCDPSRSVCTRSRLTWTSMYM